MTLLADKIRSNEARLERTVQQSLAQIQKMKREKIKNIKKALHDFFERAKEEIEEQVNRGYALHQIGVVFGLEPSCMDTQEVADMLELNTLIYSNEVGNFFTQYIDSSDFLEEFMDMFEWSHDQGLEVYWQFDENRNLPHDEYSRPRGSYTLKVDFLV